MKREIEDRRGTELRTKQNVHDHSSVLGHLIVYDLCETWYFVRIIKWRILVISRLYRVARSNIQASKVNTVTKIRFPEVVAHNGTYCNI